MQTGLSEFSLIDRFFRQNASSFDGLALGNGDDCAVITVPVGQQLCLSIDTMVEGVHFPVGCDSRHVGYRALATALSDLAAMGARPSHFSLALTLPSADEDWLSGFSQGLFELANQYAIVLVGGDTTRGPLTISVQVHGLIEQGCAITRAGAREGDLLFVTGSLGDAGGGLQCIREQQPSSEQQVLLERYYRPTPRIEEGQALSGLASSCIDISDGLVVDAAHVAQASGCRLNIDIDRLPVSSSLAKVFPNTCQELALSAGDDYELLFSISPDHWQTFKNLDVAQRCTEIGSVTAGEGVGLWQGGSLAADKLKGFNHFE